MTSWNNCLVNKLKDGRECKMCSIQNHVIKIKSFMANKILDSPFIV